MSQVDEFFLIEKYFQNIGSKFLSKKNFILGSGDDSAVFKSTNNLCYSVDQNYEGIHFPKSLPAEFIATRSVLRSFSDISAMGARPLWFSVALACDFDEKFINDFSRGLNKVSNLLRVPLIGGDLIKTSQKSVTVSVSGETKKNSHLSRSGAKHNQNIYLTGELGLARKGLEEIKKNCNKNIYRKKNVKRFKQLQKFELSKDDCKCEYEMVCKTGNYFSEKKIVSEINIKFKMEDQNKKYHIPIIISKNSYTVWWSK